MPYSITWSPQARLSYLDILDYLVENWTFEELEIFDKHTRQILQLISTFPSLYEYSRESDVHRCVLTQQISLFYQVKKETEAVELLLFWDNRQDPDNLVF